MLRRIAPIIRAAPRLCGLCLVAALVCAPDRAPAQEDARLVIVGQDGTRLAAPDRATLAALPQTEFTTHTIWTEGPQHFEGVSLATLLAHYRIDAESLDLVAVNDYTVTLPADGIGPVYPVIAHSRNGTPMSLRDKGPYWLVYDYDADPAFQRETIYMRSIWQLDRITAHSAPR